MRIVLDTVVILRSLLEPRSRAAAVLFDHALAYEMIVSPDIIAEYLDVLGRPRIVSKFPSAGRRNLQVVLYMISNATVVHPTSLPTICRDPSDAKFLAAASLASASYLVTEDKDLLVLTDFDDCAICTTGMFLDILRAYRDGDAE